MVALASVAAGAAPGHSAHAHLPLSPHVAAGSSFGSPPPSTSPSPSPSPPPPASARPRPVVAVGHREAVRRRGAVRHHAAVRHRAAHSAADPAVTIADFHFTPPSTTVHVGDTITWTNDGPSAHTATASDGSFSTGTLSKGHSASHTFTKPGTFAYVCTIHPFMHGTITVLAAATAAPAPTTTTTSAPPTTTAPAPAPTSTAPAPTSTPSASTPRAPAATARPILPVTGMDVLGAMAVGAILAGSGVALRRAVRA
jgi:plastocyanin